MARNLLMRNRPVRFGRTAPEGGGGGNNPPVPPVVVVPPVDNPAPAPRTFTQDEVNAIATRESTAAQRTAQQQLLQQLGFESAEAAQAAIAAAKAAEEAGKTDLQRQQEATAAAKAAADADRAAAATERFEARVERAFAQAGIPVEDEAKLGRLRRMVTLDNSADAAAIKAEIETLKTEFPGLFGVPGIVEVPPAPGSDPKGGPPPTPPGSKSKMELGRERAKSRSGASAGGYLTPPGL